MITDIKVGCDVVQVSRIVKMMSSQTAMKKVFHTSEMKRYDPEHLAGIFAVKESAFKALGLSSDSWLDIEVKYLPSGKPELVLASRIDTSKIQSMDISISHDAGLAFAVATVLTNN